MSVLRIALAQINPTVGDLEGNARAIVSGIKRAADLDADLVITPELALCGYPAEDLLLQPGFVKDCAKALAWIITAAQDLTAVVGFPDAYHGKIFNAAAVIAGGSLLGVYYKRELPNYGVFDERRYFSPGRRAVVLEAEGLRLLLTICEDIWIPGGAVEKIARHLGVEVVLNLSSSPYYAGKFERRREVLAGFARRARAWLCYCNLTGGQDELVFDGRSLVMDPDGRTAASAKSFEEDLLIWDVELAPALVPGKLRLAGVDEVPLFISLPFRLTHREVETEVGEPSLARVEEIHAALVLGLRDYVRKNGFRKVVIGLSGGIDSSLAAALAVRALGPENVIGVTMPSPYTSAETLADARQVAANLGLRLFEIPLSAIFASYLAELAGPLEYGLPGVEAENLQARIRGSLLMALSNRFGWLVLTTGNKSETAVGYATLYGDMAGGFALIKDVFKTGVYELAEFENHRAGRELIPPSVFTRPPTAELRPGQRDEDFLPPYEVLDSILEGYIEEDKSREELIAEGWEAAEVERVIQMVDRSEYKRRQAPPGVKITPKAFGRDRRMPITNRYHGWGEADAGAGD